MAAHKKYTEEHLEFLRVGYKKMNKEDLTAAFNAEFNESKTVTAIGSVLFKYKIKCGRKHSERFITRHKLLTAEQDAYVRDAYKKHTLRELVVRLNKKFGTNFTFNQIKAYVCNHRILSGRMGYFEENHTPWNACLYGVIPANSGSFKPGYQPATTKPLYHERISKDGLVEIKVPVGTITKYVPKQRWIYENHYGPIPPDKVVSFKDSDRSNFDPENLILLTRAEMLRLNQNGYGEHNPDIKPAVLALSKLQVKVSERKKEIA